MNNSKRILAALLAGAMSACFSLGLESGAAIQAAASNPDADLDAIIQKDCDTIQEAIELYNLSNPTSN